jgi:hypothetical protein
MCLRMILAASLLAFASPASADAPGDVAPLPARALRDGAPTPT